MKDNDGNRCRLSRIQNMHCFCVARGICSNVQGYFMWIIVAHFEHQNWRRQSMSVESTALKETGNLARAFPFWFNVYSLGRIGFGLSILLCVFWMSWIFSCIFIATPEPKPSNNIKSSISCFCHPSNYTTTEISTNSNKFTVKCIHFDVSISLFAVPQGPSLSPSYSLHRHFESSEFWIQFTKW